MSLKTLIESIKPSISKEKYPGFHGWRKYEQRVKESISNNRGYQLTEVNIDPYFRWENCLKMSWNSADLQEEQGRQLFQDLIKHIKTMDLDSSSLNYILGWNLSWEAEDFQQLEHLSWSFAHHTSIREEDKDSRIELRGFLENLNLSVSGKSREEVNTHLDYLQPRWAGLDLEFQDLKEIVGHNTICGEIGKGIRAGLENLSDLYRVVRHLYIVPKRTIPQPQQWPFPLKQEGDFYEIDSIFFIPVEDIPLYESILGKPLITKGGKGAHIFKFIKTYNGKGEKERLQDLQRFAEVVQAHEITSWGPLHYLSNDIVEDLEIPNYSKLKSWHIQCGGKEVGFVGDPIISFRLESDKITSIKMKIPFSRPEVLLDFQEEVCQRLGLLEYKADDLAL